MSELLNDIQLKLENAIADRLNDTDDYPLTCKEIHELASAYAEICKVSYTGPICACGIDEVNLDAWPHE